MGTLKEIKKKIRKDMGWRRWLMGRIVLLLDFKFQYELWLMRQHLYHLSKVEEIEKKLKKIAD